MSYIRAMRMLGLILLAVLPAPGAAHPQERSQADIMIRSVTVAAEGRGPRAVSRLFATVVIYSFHDDDAQDATVRILLPVGVQFQSASTGCAVNASPGATTHGVVTCNLGNLAVGATRTVQVATTLPPSGVPRKFGAFVWSLSPDPNPGNNYGEGTAP